MDDRYEALRLRNQPCFGLYLCAKELTRRYDRLLEALNLTYTQYVVMVCLWEMGSASAGAMSRALMLDPSTLTPVLKKLEQKGYVSRERDPRDERSLVVALTSAGLALRDAAADIPGRMCDCMGLAPDEAQTMARLAEKVLRHATRPGEA